MSRAVHGDTHRFGLYVRPSDQGQTFEKPRSAHLEFLFFDKRSPLSEWLEHLLPGRFFFDIQCVSNWEARVQDLSNLVLESPVGLNLSEGKSAYAESFAHWSLLALAFGLSDLHCGNCLVIDLDGKSIFQPIDLELGFEPVTNLVDTGLLNHPSLPVSRAGYLAQWGVDEQQVVQALFPLTEVVESLIRQFRLARSDLNQIAELVWRENLNRPLRRIPKLTETYRAALSGAGPDRNNFTAEEQLQLDMGDIPYFFSVHPKAELNYFSSPSRVSVVNGSFGLPQKLELADLKSSVRQEKLLKVSCLQLLRRFWPKDSERIEGVNFSAFRKDEMLTLKTDEFQVATKV